ncbi:NAD(P)/FAD-dependent oxidoreductase [Streptomyces sp. NPDC005438]|uniref:phytoene desaturase family protein n=1 Tax=Streptomyces sp. NPDC005438 TaxID=3156880 RepID=UPI0033B23724
MGYIAVIGAGMGAMAASARLAYAGHQVTVFERTDTYGGGVRRHERDGFGFDTGPGLLHLPAVYRDLFVKTGRRSLEECVELVQVDPSARHLFADGTELTLPNASRAGVVDALDKAVGHGAGERWSALVQRGRETWEDTRRPLLEEPLDEDLGALGQDPYPARRRGLLRRRSTTLSEVAQHELGEPRLVALLESYAWLNGFDPARTPGSAAILPYLEQTFGTWYVRGGIRALATALYERCLECGVEFRFGSEVLRVHEEDGRAHGLVLEGGEEITSDVVVSGRPPERLGGGGGDYCRKSRNIASSPRYTVLLALRGARPEDAVHRTVVHGPERPLLVLRPDDPALRPDEDHESVVITTTLPSEEFEPDDERLADTLVATVDAAGLGLGERMLWREVRTPRDIEEQTGAPLGAVPGPSLAGADGAFLRASNRSPLDGLYRVGGWAHPGGGLAHAGMSGAMAAGLIVEGDDWRGSQ